MTEEEAIAEGFSSVAAFQEQWKQQWKRFDPAEEVWVIEFRLVEEV